MDVVFLTAERVEVVPNPVILDTFTYNITNHIIIIYFYDNL